MNLAPLPEKRNTGNYQGFPGICFRNLSLRLFMYKVKKTLGYTSLKLGERTELKM